MSSDDRARLFLAAPLSDAVRRSLDEALAGLTPHAPLINRSRLDGIHLTVHFLGQVESSTVTGLAAGLARAIEPFAAFELLVSGVGAFPSATRPRVLWAGITGPGLAELLRIHESSAQPLCSAGIELEKRAYAPHLTLGRVGRDPTPAEQRLLSTWMDRWRQVHFGTLIVDRIHLMRSDLSVRPPRYTALKTFPLQ